MTIVQMSIQPHQGYGADQIQTETTLGKFIEHLQEAAQEWGEDAKLITVDFSNRLRRELRRHPTHLRGNLRAG